MILRITKDTYEQNDKGYIVWKVYLLGILVIKVIHTTTQWDIVAKLKVNNKKQLNIKGFK